MIGERFHRFGTDVSIAGAGAAFLAFPDVIDLKHLRDFAGSGRRRMAVHFQCTQALVAAGGVVTIGSLCLIAADDEALITNSVFLSQGPPIGAATHLAGALPTAGQRGWFGMGRALLTPAGNLINHRYLGVAWLNLPLTLATANSHFTAGKFTCELAHEPDDGGITYPAGRAIT